MIEIKNLHIRLGTYVMKDVSLKVDSGEYFVILGPTGCGKTVLLECLTGIRKPDSGELWIDDRNVTALFPEERHIGYLPQDFALFPHMSVKDNIAFGLKAKKKGHDEIQSTVKRLSEALGIGGLLSRRIPGLSGGERQRVALARALATEPKVVFLDEPLSALDEDTREKLATELRLIHDQFRTTFIHISHNLEEVAQVADRVALMNRGYIEQVGTMHDLLNRPVSRYTAEFTRTRNIITGTAKPQDNGQTAISLGNNISLTASGHHADNVLVTVRPEAIVVSDKRPESSENVFEGRITATHHRGILTRIDVDIGIAFSAYAPQRSSGSPMMNTGTTVYLRIPPDAVHCIRESPAG